MLESGLDVGVGVGVEFGTVYATSFDFGLSRSAVSYAVAAKKYFVPAAQARYGCAGVIESIDLICIDAARQSVV